MIIKNEQGPCIALLELIKGAKLAQMYSMCCRHVDSLSPQSLSGSDRGLLRSAEILINMRPVSWLCEGTMAQEFCRISSLRTTEADLDLPQSAHKEQISLPLEM